MTCKTQIIYDSETERERQSLQEDYKKLPVNPVKFYSYKSQRIVCDVAMSVRSSIRIVKMSFIYQPMHKEIALKEILKFTLKQLQHVSV